MGALQAEMSEETLAAHIVAWLADQRWDVYQEVTCLGSRCDLVARRGPLLWAIECKRSLGLSILDQAIYWRGHANLVSVAVRRVHSTRGHSFVRDYGMGLFQVDDRGKVTEKIQARLQRRTTAKLRHVLREEHKTFAPAGNARSAFWSPWKGTCKAVQEFVARRPGGTPVKELVDGIKHHYMSSATARSSLIHWIERGLVSGVAIRREGKRLLVIAS